MLHLLRNLAAPERSKARDRALGATLAFVAGATNAGGFLAVGRYTSHMTGMVAGIADNLVLGQYRLVGSAAGALIAFVLGSMSTVLLVNYGKRRGLRSHFSLPLVLEAALLVWFGLLGARSGVGPFIVPLTVAVLCYLMGLQNAVITKISRAEIRTTHVTGLVTDIGIELGRALYVNRTEGQAPVRTNRARLRVHVLLFGAFVTGSLSGAAGFQAFGYVTTVPLALMLLVVSWSPVVDDVRGRFA